MPQPEDRLCEIAATADLLHEARAAKRLIAPPAQGAPADDAEAWAIHRAMIDRLGPIRGWKVGAPSPTAEPGFGALTADTIFDDGHVFEADAFRLGAVEAEIAVRFAHPLPPRNAPYDASEVLAAVGTWHAAIEVLESAFAEWREVPKLWKVADRQSHGALVLGDGRSDPPSGPLDRHPVRLTVDGETVFEHEGGNSGGDPIRLLVWLANHLRAGPDHLKAGDVVTTGSTTPFLKARAGQTVRAEFPGFGSAALTIAG